MKEEEAAHSGRMAAVGGPGDPSGPPRGRRLWAAPGRWERRPPHPAGSGPGCLCTLGRASGPRTSQGWWTPRSLCTSERPKTGCGHSPPLSELTALQVS